MSEYFINFFRYLCLGTINLENIYIFSPDQVFLSSALIVCAFPREIADVDLNLFRFKRVEWNQMFYLGLINTGFDASILFFLRFW